jgi:hypothetical protein
MSAVSDFQNLFIAFVYCTTTPVFMPRRRRAKHIENRLGMLDIDVPPIVSS